MKFYPPNHPLAGLQIWVVGTRWLQSMLFVLGIIKPAPPQPKTPLQIATDTLIETQRNLLDAKLKLERAEADVAMYEKREARLIKDLAQFHSRQKAENGQNY